MNELDLWLEEHISEIRNGVGDYNCITINNDVFIDGERTIVLDGKKYKIKCSKFILRNYEAIDYELYDEDNLVQKGIINI